VTSPALSGVDAQKDAAAARAVEMVSDGMLVGLGTGSTAAFAVRRLGARARSGLKIRGVPTSEATRRLAEAEGIPLLTLDEVTSLDVAIDGADEADRELVLIKGGGGALLREKVIARLARKFIVIADASKLVDKLGAFPLPVEVVPFACSAVAREIEGMRSKPSLRLGPGGQPFVTDNGNHVLDCRFGTIDDPDSVAMRLDAIPGVVDHGLFLGLTDTLILGETGGGTRVLQASVRRETPPGWLR
jgi:ribose 5-phosphate isomerase A